MEYDEKIAAWETFYTEAQEEAVEIEKAGKADIEQVKQDKLRLMAAPAAKSIKISMHMAGQGKPQTREWKNPTVNELTKDIPFIITRALKASGKAHATKLEQIPEPGSRNRFWRKKFEAASSKVAYGMLMLTNAKNGKAVPLPPRSNAKPVALPVASINSNTNLDPKHVSDV